MRCPSDRPTSLDRWHRLKLRIRCALTVDDPQLIACFMAQSRALVRHGQLTPWRAAETTFRLLLDTAHDHALPWHWRCLCLDHAYRPLRELESLACSEAQQCRLSLLCRQLAVTELVPSFPYLEPEGKRHE